MDSILTVQGHIGASILIYENKVVVSKKGLAGFASGGSKNDKEIWMKSITGIQIKNPSFISNGEFSIVTTGNDNKTTRDENTVTFLKKQLPEFIKAKELIEQLANK
jgi:hypothetical protein